MKWKDDGKIEEKKRRSRRVNRETERVMRKVRKMERVSIERQSNRRQSDRVSGARKVLILRCRFGVS